MLPTPRESERSDGGWVSLSCQSQRRRGTRCLGLGSRGKLVQAPLLFRPLGRRPRTAWHAVPDGRGAGRLARREAVDLIATDRASVPLGRPAPVRSSTGARGRSRSYSPSGPALDKGRTSDTSVTRPRTSSIGSSWALSASARSCGRRDFDQLASIDTRDDARLGMNCQRPPQGV